MTMSHHHKFEGKSKNIGHIDYHPDSNTLEIKFASGGTYHYPDCGIEHHEGLKNADSPGAYFHQHIRRQFKGKKKED
jgi:hypothetical protein